MPLMRLPMRWCSTAAGATARNSTKRLARYGKTRSRKVSTLHVLPSTTVWILIFTQSILSDALPFSSNTAYHWDRDMDRSEALSISIKVGESSWKLWSWVLANWRKPHVTNPQITPQLYQDARTCWWDYESVDPQQMFSSQTGIECEYTRFSKYQYWLDVLPGHRPSLRASNLGKISPRLLVQSWYFTCQEISFQLQHNTHLYAHFFRGCSTWCLIINLI